jgi:hypothetical protein
MKSDPASTYTSIFTTSIAGGDTEEAEPHLSLRRATFQAVQPTWKPALFPDGTADAARKCPQVDWMCKDLMESAKKTKFITDLCELWQIRIVALIDTGSCYSFVNKHVVTTLGLTEFVRDRKLHVKGIEGGLGHGKDMIATHDAELVIVHNRRSVTVRIPVLPDLPHGIPLLIGNDVMPAFDMFVTNISSTWSDYNNHSPSETSDKYEQDPGFVSLQEGGIEDAYIPQADYDRLMAALQPHLDANQLLPASNCKLNIPVELDIPPDLAAKGWSDRQFFSHADKVDFQKRVDEMYGLDWVEKVTKEIIEKEGMPVTMNGHLRRDKVDADGNVTGNRWCFNGASLKKRSANFVINNLTPATRIIQEVLKCQMMSQLDMSDGYMAIHLKEESRKFTTFLAPDGEMYRYKRAVYGLLPSSFAMQAISEQLQSMSNFKGPRGQAYVDDIIKGDNNIDDHIHDMVNLVKCFTSSGMKLNIKKCKFGLIRTSHLGQTLELSPDGRGSFTSHQHKVDMITNYPTPTKTSDIEKFVGIATYLSRHIPMAAPLLKPMNDIKRLKRGMDKWSSAINDDFIALKKLIAARIRTHTPMWDQPFTIITDASRAGCGGYITQTHPVTGELYIIDMFSRAFTKNESHKFPVIRELIGISSAFKKFEYYVRYSPLPFKVRTDAKALCYLHTQKEMSSQLYNWSYYLFDGFDWDIEHISGIQNLFADFLSREIYDPDRKCYDAEVEKWAPHDVQMKYQRGANKRKRAQTSATTDDTLSLFTTDHDDPATSCYVDYYDCDDEVLFVGSSSADSYIGLGQSDDGYIDVVLLDCDQEEFDDDTRVLFHDNTATPSHDTSDNTEQIVESSGQGAEEPSDTPTAARAHPNDDTIMFKGVEKKIKDYLHAPIDQMDNPTRWVNTIIRDHHGKSNIDEDKRIALIDQYHCNSHQGAIAVWKELWNDGYYYSSMLNDCRRQVGHCRQCASVNVAKVGFHPAKSQPCRLACDKWIADTAHISIKSDEGHRFIHILKDAATKYIWLRASVDNKADTMGDFLHNTMSTFGCPLEFCSDGGPEFKNGVIASLAARNTVKQTFTLPYHSVSAGDIEGTVGRVKNALTKCLHDRPTTQWHKLIPDIQFYLNKRVNETTMSSPFSLMFGRPCRHRFDPVRSPMPDELPDAEFEKIMTYIWCAVNDVVLPAIHKIATNAYSKQAQLLDNKKGRRVYNEKDQAPGKYHWVMKQKEAGDGVGALSPRWTGPYLVIDIDDNDHYTLINQDGSKFSHSVPVSHLKRLTSDWPDKIEPAAFDEVHKILTHTDVNNDPSQRRYLVQWKRHGPDAATWEAKDKLRSALDSVRSYEKSLTNGEPRFKANDPLFHGMTYRGCIAAFIDPFAHAGWSLGAVEETLTDTNITVQLMTINPKGNNSPTGPYKRVSLKTINPEATGTWTDELKNGEAHQRVSIRRVDVIMAHVNLSNSKLSPRDLSDVQHAFIERKKSWTPDSQPTPAEAQL